MSHLLVLVLILVSSACAPKSKPLVYDADGCYLDDDNCNRCCPAVGNVYRCTLRYCTTETPIRKGDR